MFGGEQGMTTAFGLVGRAVHNPSGGIPNLAWREVEVVHLHGRLLRLDTAGARCTPWQGVIAPARIVLYNRFGLKRLSLTRERTHTRRVAAKPQGKTNGYVDGPTTCGLRATTLRCGLSSVGGC